MHTMHAARAFGACVCALDDYLHCKAELVGVNDEKENVESAELALQGVGPCCAPDRPIALLL
jgi:hypothetical protein